MSGEIHFQGGSFLSGNTEIDPDSFLTGNEENSSSPVWLRLKTNSPAIFEFSTQFSAPKNNLVFKLESMSGEGILQVWANQTLIGVVELRDLVSGVNAVEFEMPETSGTVQIKMQLDPSSAEQAILDVGEIGFSLVSFALGGADSDNDGIVDLADAFPLNAGETLDSDRDGVGDSVDSDDDNDGSPDVSDTFPLDSSESIDTDGNGIGNNADPDDDADGVEDSSDNCPFSVNANQLDSDADGVGDVCDSTPLPNTAPTVRLLDGSIQIFVGDTFSDPGANASDFEDGSLTHLIVTVSNVDTTMAGTYKVDYIVTDTGGLTSSASRNVLVIARPVACTEPASGSIRLSAGQSMALPIRGSCITSPGGEGLTIPDTASAASLNVTAVAPGLAGFVTVWPCGVPRPNASNLNYVANDVMPNGVIAPIGVDGSVCLFSLAETDLLVDVAGWFEGDAFVGATPKRLIDTRNGTGGRLTKVEQTTPLSTQVTGINANTAVGSATRIPLTAQTVALNITVVNPEADGYVTVYPCDVPRPNASNLNYVAGQVIANGVLAPTSLDGKVCIFSLQTSWWI